MFYCFSIVATRVESQLCFSGINHSSLKINSFKNTIRVSNSLDPDQDRHSTSPDLGPDCLQRLSADDESCH